MAARVDVWADDVARHERGLLDGQAVEWHSTAAQEFRDGLAARSRAVRDTGAALEDLADALRRHAVAVEAQLAAITEARNWVLQEAEQARSGLTGAVGALEDWVSHRWGD